MRDGREGKALQPRTRRRMLAEAVFADAQASLPLIARRSPAMSGRARTGAGTDGAKLSSAAAFPARVPRSTHLPGEAAIPGSWTRTMSSLAWRPLTRERHPAAAGISVQVARPGGSRSSTRRTARAPPSTLRPGNDQGSSTWTRDVCRRCRVAPSTPASSKGACGTCGPITPATSMGVTTRGVPTSCDAFTMRLRALELRGGVGADEARLAPEVQPRLIGGHFHESSGAFSTPYAASAQSPRHRRCPPRSAGNLAVTVALRKPLGPDDSRAPNRHGWPKTGDGRKLAPGDYVVRVRASGLGLGWTASGDRRRKAR